MFSKISPRVKFRVANFNTPFRRKTLAYVSDMVIICSPHALFLKEKRSTLIILFRFVSFGRNRIFKNVTFDFFPQPVSDFRNGDKGTTNFLIVHSKRNTFSI